MQKVEQLEQLENIELESSSASESNMTGNNVDAARRVLATSSDNSGQCSVEFPRGKIWVMSRVKAPENESLTLIWYAEGDEELRDQQ